MTKHPNALPLAIITLDYASTTPLYQQIYERLAEAILTGKLDAGLRLPSTRELATTLGVSRNTVVTAFDQLLAEGYLEAEVGSGTYVTYTLPEDLLTALPLTNPQPQTFSAKRGLSKRGMLLALTPASISRKPNRDFVFAHGIPALDEFPFDVWSKLETRRYRQAGRLFQYGEPAGYRPLREAIASYLKASRAVNCVPEQVIICSGSQQALDLVARLLLDTGDTVWLEDPGYLGARGAFQSAGAKVVPMSVDEEGLVVPQHHSGDVRLVYVTPSHQFPIGVTMSLARRLTLLGRVNAWIIEDDYDSEYRYTGRPIPALQGLDTEGKVIYLGTFSKVLFPALRIGYLVVPPAVVDAFANAQALIHRGVSPILQATLTDFIQEGHLARHIRRMRVLYEERQAVFMEAAQRELGGFLELGAMDTGMHTVGWLPPDMNDTAMARRAATYDIETLPLSDYALQPLARGGLVLGYAAAKPEPIRQGMKRLANALL